jgi:hypothetical protein
MAAIQVSWLKKADLTVSKVLFHLIFWGLHIGIFAAGWYESEYLQSLDCIADILIGTFSHQIQSWRR